MLYWLKNPSVTRIICESEKSICYFSLEVSSMAAQNKIWACVKYFFCGSIDGLE